MNSSRRKYYALRSTDSDALVVRVSEAKSREIGPAYRFAQAGYEHEVNGLAPECN